MNSTIPEASPFEALYGYYMDTGRHADKEMRRCEEILNRQIDHLPFEHRDAIWCAVNRMNAQQDRIAFFEGLKIGAQIVLEFLK